MGVCDMNQETAYVILLNKDSTISTKLLDEYDPSKHSKAKYILFPNYRDSNYFIVQNSEFVRLKSARISYGLMMDYIDRDFCDDDFDPRTEEDSLVQRWVEVNTAYEFYVALWNVFYFRMVSEIMYRGDVENCNAVVFTVPFMAIDVTLDDGSVVSFEWIDNPKSTVVTNMIKLMTKLCDTFKIPHRKFRDGSKYIRIEDNMWDIIEEKEMNKKDMIGFVSSMACTVNFYSANDIIWKIASQRIDVEFNVINIGPLEEFEEFRNLKKHLDDGRYLNNILDIGEFPNIIECGSFIICEPLNEKLTFMSNIRSFIHYIEGCGAAYIDKSEDSTAIVTMGYSTSKNDRTRREVNLTRKYISFL